MIKLSIITICYNEPNLEKTCESIVNQTFQDFEWIVVDGGSNQETQDIWNKYKYRIDKFISEPDDGLYNAMNKGIKLANCEYLNFMNAGDRFFSNKILELVFFNKKYNADILYGNCCLVSQIKHIKNAPISISAKFLYNDTINHQSSFIKKELFDKYGYYNEEYQIASDWEKWIVYFKNNCQYLHLDFPITNYNMYGLSETNIQLSQQERTIIANKYFSKEEIESFKDTINQNNELKRKYTFLERIFSIKNEYSNDKQYKVITILGIKLKFKK